MTRLYEEVVRVPVPDVGSVPACAVTKYWEELKYPLDVKYLRKRLMSALKFVLVEPSARRNEKTLLYPFDPVYRFQVKPARLMLDTVGTGFPVASQLWAMGPALKLSSQIIISFSPEPPDVDDVKRS